MIADAACSFALIKLVLVLGNQWKYNITDVCNGMNSDTYSVLTFCYQCFITQSITMKILTDQPFADLHYDCSDSFFPPNKNNWGILEVACLLDEFEKYKHHTKEDILIYTYRNEYIPQLNVRPVSGSVKDVWLLKTPHTTCVGMLVLSESRWDAFYGWPSPVHWRVTIHYIYILQSQDNT